jgi:hypothetical protein
MAQVSHPVKQVLVIRALNLKNARIIIRQDELPSMVNLNPHFFEPLRQAATAG